MACMKGLTVIFVSDQMQIRICHMDSKSLIEKLILFLINFKFSSLSRPFFYKQFSLYLWEVRLKAVKKSLLKALEENKNVLVFFNREFISLVVFGWLTFWRLKSNLVGAFDVGESNGWIFLLRSNWASNWALYIESDFPLDFFFKKTTRGESIVPTYDLEYSTYISIYWNGSLVLIALS